MLLLLLTDGASADLVIKCDGKDVLKGNANKDVLITGFLEGLTDAQLATTLDNRASALSLTSGRFQTAAEGAKRLEQQLTHLNDSAASSPSGGFVGGEITDHLSEVASG
jgi:hypothetical protein